MVQMIVVNSKQKIPLITYDLAEFPENVWEDEIKSKKV